MASWNVRIRPRKDDLGQATVEFAVLLPLFVTCLALLIATTALALSSLRLADTARTAARVASTAQEPHDAVASFVASSDIQESVSFDVSQQFLTVRVTRKIRLPLIGLPLPVVHLTAHSTVLYEGVPALLK